MTFVRNHAKSIVACDFFVSVTVHYQMLYVFVLMEVASRRLVHFNVTSHPTAAWALQQFREAIDNDQSYRFLIHDRDNIFSQELDPAVGAMGVKVLKTPFHSPQANSHCERLNGMPAGSIVKLLEMKPRSQISDEMLVLIDVAAKARLQLGAFVADVLLKHLPKERAADLATALTDGRWTHDFPIPVEAAKQMGLPISVNMPRAIYQLMDLYPQTGIGRPSVLYVPFRRSSPAKPEASSPDPSPSAQGQ
jgi:Serine dehydrogenase proteinase